MSRKGVIRWLASLGFAALAGGWLALHAPSVCLGFVSDDYCMLMKPSLLPTRGWYRYSPVGLALWRALGLMGEDPRVFRTAVLTFHAGVTALVFILTRRLHGNGWAGLLAVALFVGRPEHHEAVYWNSAGLFYLPMSAAVLGALCLAAREPVIPWRRYVLAYPLLLTVACFAHESGALLVLGLVAQELVSPPRERQANGGLWVRTGRLLPSLFPVAALVAIKHFASARLSPMLSRASVQATVIEVAHAVKALFIPFLSPRPQWVPHLGTIFGLSFCVLLLPLALLLSVRQGRKYAGLYLISVSALMAARLHAALQDRFFYLPSALVSCLMASGLASVSEHYVRAGRVAVWPRSFIGRLWIGTGTVLLLSTGTLLYQAPRLRALRQSWEEASRLCETIVEQSRSHLERFPEEVQEVYFLGPPDHVPVPDARALSPAYVFRTGITEALWRAQVRWASGSSLARRRYHVWPIHRGDPATAALLERARADSRLRILSWDPQTRSVILQ